MAIGIILGQIIFSNILLEYKWVGSTFLGLLTAAVGCIGGFFIAGLTQELLKGDAGPQIVFFVVYLTLGTLLTVFFNRQRR